MLHGVPVVLSSYYLSLTKEKGSVRAGLHTPHVRRGSCYLSNFNAVVSNALVRRLANTYQKPLR